MLKILNFDSIKKYSLITPEAVIVCVGVQCPIVDLEAILDGTVIRIKFEVLNFDASCIRTARNFKLGPSNTHSYCANHNILLWFKTSIKLRFETTSPFIQAF